MPEVTYKGIIYQLQPNINEGVKIYVSSKFAAENIVKLCLMISEVLITRVTYGTCYPVRALHVIII